MDFVMSHMAKEVDRQMSGIGAGSNEKRGEAKMVNDFKRIIKTDRSVIVAADIDRFDILEDLAAAAQGVAGISGFKFGFSLGLKGLAEAVSIVKKYCPWATIIYDHQKAANDIPAMGEVFAKTLVNAGVDAAILFPFTGPATQTAWTNACFTAGLEVIVGGEMTHECFLESEGGYISDKAPKRIYQLAVEMGVRHFVVPGNKLGAVCRYRALLEEDLDEGGFALYAPGFITQGGSLSVCGKAAGKIFHGIVGGAIYNKPTVEEMRQAMISCTSALSA